MSRDVYIEVGVEADIQITTYQCLLNRTSNIVLCGLDVSLLSTSRVQGKLTAELLLGATTVQHVDKEVDVAAGPSAIPMTFDLKAPILWSPELPNLYTLRIKLKSPSGEDVFS